MVPDLAADVSQDVLSQNSQLPLNVKIFSPSECPLLVVKIGSSLLVEKEGHIRKPWLATLVSDLAERHRAGQKIIIVTSGAIALGARRLKLEKGGRATLADAQAAASAGQILLSGSWAELLDAYEMVAAQMLVTLDDLEDRRRYLNISATLGRLLKAGAIPIINENDSVATEEIRFGDNDRLAARVAQAADANGVILLSDVDGLYDRNPSDADAQLIPFVEKVDETIRSAVAAGSGSGMGTGGMGSKLDAAQIASLGGVSLAIISGLHDHPMRRFSEGGPSTVFGADESKGARKNWLGGRLTAKGRIFIDAGAAQAIIDGNSLLPAGAITVEGDFDRGDVVDIMRDGKCIARGLAEYGVDDALLICGRKSSELADVLGTVPRKSMVHRDQLVIL